MDPATTERSVELSYDQAMGLAMKLHREGRLEAAARLYDTLRRMAPGDPNPVHFLGVLQGGEGLEHESRIVSAQGRNGDRLS